MSTTRPEEMRDDVDDASSTSLVSRPRHAHPERDTVILAVILSVAAVGLLLTVPDLGQPTRGSSWLVLPVLAAGFALAEYSVFRFLFRRESVAFSLSEIPLAFALVFVAPVPALVVRTVGATATLLAIRRPPPYKVVLNVGMFAVETALAFVVFRGIVALGGNTDTVLVVAAIVVAIVMGVVSSVVVGVAISRFEGGLWQRLAGEFDVAWWLFVVNATLAGMVLGLALISPWLLLVALIPVGGVVVHHQGVRCSRPTAPRSRRSPWFHRSCRSVAQPGRDRPSRGGPDG